MSIHPTEPGEIYEDKHGQRWLVVSLCNEPTVTMQQILPHWSEAQPPPNKQSGGIAGLMWDGFKKIADGPKEPR